MRTVIGWTLVVSLLCLLAFAPPAHATVDWEEGFEYTTAANMWAVWEESCQNNPTLSTTRARSGSKSLRHIFVGTTGGCYMDRYLPALGETLYTRFYMYMDNFTVSTTGTKSTFHGQAGAYPSFWWVMKWGQPIMSVEVQGIILDNGSQDTVQVYGGTIPQNQWVCVETRLTMSSPGVDNGIIQQWINNVQTINKTNQRMRAATLNQQNSPTAKFGFVRLYVQHGDGSIYYDDYAVSRDARIGCAGTTPPVDTTPPGPVQNFQVQ